MSENTFNVGDRVIIEGRGDGWDGITGVVAKAGSNSGGQFNLIAYDNPEDLPSGKHDLHGSWSDHYLRRIVRFAAGTPVRVSRETTARYVGTDSEFDLAAGQVLYVAEHVEEFGQYRLASDPVDVIEKDPGETIWVNDADVESLSGSTLRASLQHETSRQYAADSRSRKLLTDEQNLILELAFKGEEVDVYDFRKAATAALSAASTRAGQSPARREYAKRARHLIYWADALIDNHVKGLPVYEKGERSPKIKALEAETQDLQATIDADREQWKAEVSELRAALAEAKAELDKTVDTLRTTTKNADFVKHQHDIILDVLHYASDRLKAEEAGRLHGYWDALRAERGPAPR